MKEQIIREIMNLSKSDKLPDFDNSLEDCHLLIKKIGELDYQFYYSYVYDTHRVKIIKHTTCFVGESDFTLNEAFMNAFDQLLSLKFLEQLLKEKELKNKS
jgi:hypothetical protein